MRAQDLFNVMKTVPRDAWPRTLLGWLKNSKHAPTDEASEACELMCIGSMTNYLMGKGHHYFEYILGDDSVTLKMYDNFTVCVPLDFGGAQTHTRLLAKACEELSNHEDQT